MGRWGTWLALVALAGIGCGGATPPPQPAVTAQALVVPDLLSVVPRGVESLIHFAPARLTEEPAFSGVVDAIVGASQRDALERLFGLRLDEIDEVVWVHFVDTPEDAFVVLLRARRPMREVAQAVGMRMNTVEVSADQPFVRRVGFVGVNRREVVALADDVLVYASGSGPSVADTVRLARRVNDAMERAHSNVESSALPDPEPGHTPLAERRVDAPFAYYRATPFDLRGETDAARLLLGHEQIAVAVAPRGDDTLRFGVRMDGQFPPEAETHFRAGLTSISRSAFGTVTGFDEAIASLVVRQGTSGMALRVDWPSARLTEGVRTLFVDDLHEILDRGL